MKLLHDHHHYKRDLIMSDDRPAIYERYVIDLLISSELPDSERESSIAFELKHHHSVAQFSRLLAQQRGLQEDVCVVGSLLHDVHVIINGSYQDHAHRSAEIATVILEKLGLFSEEEKKNIIKIIYHHSDKEVWSDDPYEEIGKDADVLDSFLYPNAFGFYLKHKRFPILEHYIKRAKLVWNELNIPVPIAYSVLDNYNANWLDQTTQLSYQDTVTQLAFLMFLFDNYSSMNLLVPSFCVFGDDETYNFSFNTESTLAFSTAFTKYFSSSYYFAEFKIPDTVSVGTQYFDYAKSVLEELDGKLLLIWPAINSYELIDPITNSERVSDLGIKVEN